MGSGSSAAATSSVEESKRTSRPRQRQQRQPRSSVEESKRTSRPRQRQQRQPRSSASPRRRRRPAELDAVAMGVHRATRLTRKLKARRLQRQTSEIHEYMRTSSWRCSCGCACAAGMYICPRCEAPRPVPSSVPTRSSPPPSPSRTGPPPPQQQQEEEEGHEQEKRVKEENVSGTVPAQPRPPLVRDQTSTTATVQWQPTHTDDGGSPLRSFGLQMKSGPPHADGNVVADVAELSRWSFVARELKPGQVYSARIRYFNVVGASKWSAFQVFRTQLVSAAASSSSSSSSSVHQQQRQQVPLRVAGFWREFFDDASQCCFYYNVRTRESVWRQPHVFAEAAAAVAAAAAAVPMSSDVAFRRARFRFFRSLNGGGQRSSFGRGHGTGGSSPTSNSSSSSSSRRSTVTVRVRRASLLEDGRAALDALDAKSWALRWRIEYVGEEGIDGGGLLRDFFLQLSRALFAPAQALFVHDASGRCIPNPSYMYQEETWDAEATSTSSGWLFFVGKFLAKALRDRHCVAAPLHESIMKALLLPEQDGGGNNAKASTGAGAEAKAASSSSSSSSSFSIQDLETMAPATCQALRYITDLCDGADDDVAAVGNKRGGRSKKREAARRAIADLDLDFSVPSPTSTTRSTQSSIIPLRPGGEDLAVTLDNAREYVSLRLDWETRGRFADQLRALRAGFNIVVPIASVAAALSPAQTLLCLNGEPDYDPKTLLDSSVFTHGLTRGDPLVADLLEVLARLEPEGRRGVLEFTTGSPRLPLDGLDPPFTVAASDATPDTLPRAATCFHRLILPRYGSAALLEEKLMLAVQNTRGFAFA